MSGFSPIGSAPTGSLGASGAGTVYTLTRVAGSFALSGTSDTLTRYSHPPLALTPGTFHLNGSIAAISRPHAPLALVPGSFHLTGTTALVVYGYLLNEAVGHFLLAGSGVTLTPNWNAGTHNIVLANPGTYTLTGTPDTVLERHKLAGVPGSFVISPGSQTYNIGLGFIETPGHFTLSGIGTMVWPHKLPLVSGALSFLPLAAQLRVGHKLPRVAGTFTLNGTAATIPAPGYRLAAAPGSFVTTHPAVAMHPVRRLAEVPGSFALSGIPVSARATHSMSLGSGTFNLLGIGTFARNRKVTGSGAFALTGKPVTALLTRRVRLVPASFALAGTADAITRSRRFANTPGTFTLTGVAIAGARNQPPMSLAAGAFALGGTADSFKRPRRGLAATAGQFILTGTASAATDSGSYEGLYNDTRWLAISSVTPVSAIELAVSQGGVSFENDVPPQ